MKDKDVIAQVIEQFKDDVSIVSESPITEWINTGNFALNRILSGDYLKGYPVGRIVEVIGDPASGKSMLFYYAVAQWQKKYGIHNYIIYDDTEGAVTPNSMGDIAGVQCDKVVILHSPTVEDHFEKVFLGSINDRGKVEQQSIIQFIFEKDSEAKILIVLDSVTQLSTRHEIKSSFDTRDMTKAQLVGKGLRQVDKEYVYGHDILYLVSNQLRDRIGGYGGKVTTSGKGLPYSASIILHLDVIDKIKIKNLNTDRDEVIGVVVEAVVTKNKLAAPFEKCEISFILRKNNNLAIGMNVVSGVVDLLVAEGKIKYDKGRIIKSDNTKMWAKDFTEEDLMAVLSNF